MRLRVAGAAAKRLLFGACACALSAGCDAPPLKLVYRVASGPAQTCAPPSQAPNTPAKCSDVDMECEAVLNVRVIRQSEPNAPWIAICEPVQPNGEHDLCAIAGIDLPTDREVPRETLEVQVMVWPRYLVEDPVTGELNCRRHDVRFSAIDGFPIEQPPTPAFGGRAFYHPGDDKVVVTLGCTDSDAINVRSCVGASAVDVLASVDDFDSHFSVTPATASRLAVAIGEPSPSATPGSHVLTAADKRDLGRPSSDEMPVWDADVEFKFDTTMCLEVVEDGAIAATVRCAPIGATGTQLKPIGMRLRGSTLHDILRAVGVGDTVPPQGITIGIVLDHFAAAAGYTVVAEGSTILYLSEGRDAVVPGATATTKSGVFVSLDAPYDTVFEASNGGPPRSAIGGLIEGKVTIVVLKVGQ